MGNNQQTQSESSPRPLTYQRFCSIDPMNQESNQNADAARGQSIKLDEFKCIEINAGGKNGQDFKVEANERGVVVTKYYENISDLERYISNLIKISKLLDVGLYDELKMSTNETPYSSTLAIESPGLQVIRSTFLSTWSYSKKIDLLYFVTVFLKKFDNLYLCPHFIAETPTNGFYLINFATTSIHSPAQIFLGFFRWLFAENLNFADCLTSEMAPAHLPIYLQQIYSCLSSDEYFRTQEVGLQLKMVQDKMTFFNNRTDSFYACQYFNKTQRYATKSEWIFMKFKNEICFYHCQDQHAFTGRLIRKKKKVDISQCHIAFDYEDLEILYVPENSKFMVKASEFEFEACNSISDIEIKYKLPIKFKSCLINRARNGDIFLLDQNLYRYISQTNKLVQQTKRISDYIFLTSTRDSIALILKLSIDIFRNGIRVLYKNEQLTLAHAGDQKVLEQISSIRLDVRSAVFCVEVYKGVFLMMASKNLWVLDLNFLCYFSFATPSQLKKLTSFQSERKQESEQHNDQLYCILNQPFRVNFNIESDGNNAAIKDNYLHILGLIEGQPYYLKYSFLHRIGAIKLEGYHPLYVQSTLRLLQPHADFASLQDYRFNFHEENSHLYKYRTWIFNGKLLVNVYDFKIRFLKNTYEVHLSIEKISQTLREHIQSLNAHKTRLSKIQQVLLLYKIYLIYEYLFLNSITHSNISITHICFTHQKQLKIHGWSEPPRNWHVSDYKDYLLVCFNVITYNTYEKISDKILSKFETELSEYPVLNEKIACAFKQTKTMEKHAEIEKSLLLIKSSLEKQLCNVIHSRITNKFIFSFEYKTPRMTMLNIETQKMKKITIVPEETVGEEFIFTEADKCVWDEEKGKLYILTANHQFYEVRIGMECSSEEKTSLEDYECLPHSISLSTFKCVRGDIYSFGGIKKQSDGRSVYCTKVYKFNWKTLTWDHVCELPEPRINPHLVSSVCGRYIFIFGGGTQPEYPYLKLLKFDTLTCHCQLLADKSSFNVRAHQSSQAPMKIFHISEQLHLFALWSIEDGDYILRYVSYSSIGFDIELRVKNYSNENVLAEESVTLHEDVVHILRSYGKYTKMTVHRLESLTLKHETIYAI